MNAFDRELFLAINRLPESWAPLMKLASEALNGTPGKIALGLLLVGMLVRGGRARPTVILALIAFPLANEITDLFKAYLPVPRPFQVIPETILRVGWSDSMGTASAHSANMAAVATVFLGMGLLAPPAPRRLWAGIAWVCLALLVGFSRIYNGAHYPSQVLLGWICGAAAGLFVLWAWGRLLNWKEKRETAS